VAHTATRAHSHKVSHHALFLNKKRHPMRQHCPKMDASTAGENTRCSSTDSKQTHNDFQLGLKPGNHKHTARVNSRSKRDQDTAMPPLRHPPSKPCDNCSATDEKECDRTQPARTSCMISYQTDAGYGGTVLQHGRRQVKPQCVQPGSVQAGPRSASQQWRKCRLRR
jgi:hypothetical protein